MDLIESFKMGVILLVCYDQGSWFVAHYPAFESDRKPRQVEILKDHEIEQVTRAAPAGNHWVQPASSSIPSCECF